MRNSLYQIGCRDGPSLPGKFGLKEIGDPPIHTLLVYVGLVARRGYVLSAIACAAAARMASDSVWRSCMGSALAPISVPVLDTAQNAGSKGSGDAPPTAQLGHARGNGEAGGPHPSSQHGWAVQSQDAASAATYFPQPADTSANPHGTHSGPDGEQSYQVSDAVVLALQIRAMGTVESGAGQPTPASSGAQAAGAPLNLQSEENQLQTALKSMGLSPGAIQEFMYVAKVLAQVAPSIFQSFVAQMVNLADASQGVSASSAAPPRSASAAPASSAQGEDISIQVAEAVVNVSQTAQGVTLSVAAEAESINLAYTQVQQNAGSTSTARHNTEHTHEASARDSAPSKPRASRATA